MVQYDKTYTAILLVSFIISVSTLFVVSHQNIL